MFTAKAKEITPKVKVFLNKLFVSHLATYHVTLLKNLDYMLKQRQNTPHFSNIHFNIILTYTPDLPSAHFLMEFMTKIMYAFQFSTKSASRPAHTIT